MDERTYVAVEMAKVLVLDKDLRSEKLYESVQKGVDPVSHWAAELARVAFAVSDAISKEALSGGRQDES